MSTHRPPAATPAPQAPATSEAHRLFLPPPDKPCPRCPWSRNTPPGEFPRQRYEQLRCTVGAPGAEVLPGTAGMFACHKTREGFERPCRGWLAVVGWHHLTVRLAVHLGHLRSEDVEPRPEWQLFTDYDELIAVQAADD